MPFELTNTTQVLITNANPRREFHGPEKVRAIDITFCVKGENTLLDLIEPGLRKHHYFNKAAEDGQETAPSLIEILPNLRYPRLPRSFVYAKGEKWRGYRFVRDWGTDGEHIDFTDVVLASLHYEINEGGTVSVIGTVQYNGDELQDNDLYGELSGLASEGEIFIKLLAPAELVPAKKGYRAGKPDTPLTHGGGDLLPEPEGDEQEEDEEEPEQSAEEAFIGTADKND